MTKVEVQSTEWTIHPVIAQKPRENPMQVLCLGLSRTGTMSLYYALKILGYEPYHAGEASVDYVNNSLVNWHKALTAKMDGLSTPWKGDDFEKMLWRYDKAVTDVPAILFPEELIEAYPDAKVIINTRDFAPWKKSIENSVYEILSWKWWWITDMIDPQHMRCWIDIVRRCRYIWTDGTPSNRDRLSIGYNKHYKLVRELAPKGKTLEYTIKEGWAPLCAFLEKPVPSVPFPWVNEGDAIAKSHEWLFWWRLKLRCRQIALKLAPIVIVVLVGIWSVYYI